MPGFVGAMLLIKPDLLPIFSACIGGTVVSMVTVFVGVPSYVALAASALAKVSYQTPSGP